MIPAPETAGRCPCGTGLGLDACCGRLHRGLEIARTPERLMRSRFSAFVRGEVDYLLATSHPAIHAPREREIIEEACRSTHWLALRVIRATDPVDDRGEVEFAAWHGGSPVGQLHETSLFVREAGRWLYRSGTILPAIEIGRNDPCWCGSGSKRKKCHPG